MPRVRSLALQKSHGILPSRGGLKSRSPPWPGKQSTAVKTCSQLSKPLSALSQSDTPEGLKQAIEGRILALAKVHSLFVDTRWIGAKLSTIASQELAPYSEKDEAGVRISGPQVLLEPNVAQVVAVTLHELATNAAKYGALSVPNGRMTLKWTHNTEGQLVLHWAETGGPAVKIPTHQGFGTRIIERMIGQLKGKARFDWHADGLVCEITLQV